MFGLTGGNRKKHVGVNVIMFISSRLFWFRSAGVLYEMTSCSGSNPALHWFSVNKQRRHEGLCCGDNGFWSRGAGYKGKWTW